MTKIANDQKFDKNLVNDCGQELNEFEFHEFAHGDAPNGTLQICFHSEAGRAGIVYTGSGSSGQTYWTDAVSVDDAYDRYVNNNLSN